MLQKGWFGASRAGVLAALVSTIGLGLLLAGTALAQPNGDQLGKGSYRMMATYFDVDGFDSTLMLNNKGRAPLEVVIEAFDRAGNSVALRTIEVPANDFLEASLEKLIGTLPPGRRSGSLELRYGGRFLELGAQIHHLDKRTGSAFAEQLTRPREYVSASLRGSWTLADETHDLVWIVTNTSPLPRTARVEVAGPGTAVRSQEVALAGRQTRIIGLGRKIRAGRIDVAHDGAAGDVLVRGFVRGERSVGLMGLHDPARASHAEWFGNGLWLGRDAQLTLGLANHDGNASEVVVSAVVTAGGEPLEVVLPAVTLAAGELRDVGGLLLAEIAHAVDLGAVSSAGLSIAYSTAPGTVTVHASSWDAGRGLRFDLPVLAPGEMFSSAGIYPFRLRAGETTLFHVHNLTREPRTHAWHVVQAGEVVYASGYQLLQPGETMSVDLRTLRDQRLPDAKGRSLGDRLEHGQIHWSFVGNGIALDARVERIDELAKRVSSYACANCCNTTGSPEVHPDWVNGFVGQPPVFFTATMTTEDCYGNVLYIDDLFVTNVTWSGPPGVVQTIFNSLECVGPGFGTAWVRVFDPFSEGGYTLPYCAPIPAPINQLPVPVQVNAPPALTGPDSVVRNGSATFTITNLVAGHTISSWKFTDGQTTVTRTTSTSATTWSGNMVKSGTVSVRVVQDDMTFELSKQIEVTARSSFAFAAATPTKVANGFEGLMVPDPPVAPNPGDKAVIARFQLRQRSSFNTATVPSGPNLGFWYVTTATNTSGQEATAFRWVISPSVETPTSEFFLAQCGSNGFISGAQLKANAQQHEAGTMGDSHYVRYVAAQNDPENNIGLAVEKQVAVPTTTSKAFTSQVEGVIGPKIQAILTATQVEPCGGDVTKDSSTPACTDGGGINFAPYQPCS